MLAAVWGIRSFRHFLHGAAHPFILYTDHHSLLWLSTNTHLEGQFMRWACLIGDFDFRIVHKPGIDHLVADGPSRHPCLSTVDRTGSREETPDPPRAKDTFTLLTPFSGVAAAEVALAHIPSEYQALSFLASALACSQQGTFERLSPSMARLDNPHDEAEDHSPSPARPGQRRPLPSPLTWPIEPSAMLSSVILEPLRRGLQWHTG